MRTKMKHKLNIKVYALVLMLSTSQLLALDPAMNTKVKDMISMCGTKINLVDNKTSLFTYPPKPVASKMNLFSNSADKKANNIWNAKKERIDTIMKDYLALMNQTKIWYHTNNAELKNISDAKIGEKSIEYVHNCNLFVNSIADELYWFQGKTPPGGFKNGMSAAYFDKRFPKVVE